MPALTPVPRRLSQRLVREFFRRAYLPFRSPEELPDRA